MNAVITHPLEEEIPMREGDPEGETFGVSGPVDWRNHWLDQILAMRAGPHCGGTRFQFLDGAGEIETELSPAQVMDQALAAAGIFRALLPERARIVLLAGNHPAFLAGFFGALYAGCVPVSGVNPLQPGAAARLAHILADSGAVAVFGLRDDLAAFQPLCPPSGKVRRVKWIPLEGARGESGFAPWRGSRFETALIQYSSGTGGLPRGVMLSHDNVQHNLQALVRSLGFRRTGGGLTWLPLTHDMGLLGGLLLGLACGQKTCIQRPEDFVEDPLRWPAAISRHGIYFSGGPDFAYRLAADRLRECQSRGERTALDLSCWGVAVIGAERVRPKTARDFAAGFGPCGFDAAAFRPCYGMAETSLILAAAPGLEARIFSGKALAEGRAVPLEGDFDAADGAALASCGKAVEGHEILIVDESAGTPLAEGQVGEVWCSGPCVAQGYAGSGGRAGEKARFAAPSGGRNWLGTGDRGFFLEGSLYVLGRMAEGLVLPRGVFDPHDLAERLERGGFFPPRSQGAALEMKNGLLRLLLECPSDAVLPEGRPQAAARLGAELARLTGGGQGRIWWARPGSLPRTPSGKLRIKAAFSLLDAGQLAPWAQDDWRAGAEVAWIS